jgi:hypothetical protein
MLTVITLKNTGVRNIPVCFKRYTYFVGFILFFTAYHIIS